MEESAKEIPEIQISDDENEMEREYAVKEVSKILPSKEPFDIQVGVVKLYLQGSEQEKDMILKKRLQKFFDYGENKVFGDQFSCPRFEADYRDQATIPNEVQLIIFGTDFLGRKQLKLMLNCHQIEKINQSNCRVVFNHAHEVCKALQENVKDKAAYQIKVEEDDQNIHAPRAWIELRPYTAANVQRKLFARYATNQETNLEKQKNKVTFYFNQIKKKYDEALQKAQQQHLFKRNEILQRINQKNNEIQNLEQRGRERSREKTNRPNYWNECQSYPKKTHPKQISADSLDLSMNEDKISESGSGLSFLMSQSKKDMQELNKELNDFNFDSKSQSSFAKSNQNPMENEKQKINISINENGEVQFENGNDILNLSFNEIGEKLNFTTLNGSKDKNVELSFTQKSTSSSKFNYKEYVEATEKLSKCTIPLITID